MPIKEIEPNVTHVVDGESSVLAVVIRNSFDKDGVNFFTPQSYPFQLGFIKQPKGYVSKPHTHTLLPETNIVQSVQEVVFVVEGIFEVDFYGTGEEILEKAILHQGDSCLFVSGGHGYKVSEDCKVITVKQGPYPGAETAKKYI